ncbi:MAG: hypothetical protein JSS87_13320 [Acidobacteria bacterium]|nr:hypothetical protein [Acidobacteriota bacterium]
MRIFLIVIVVLLGIAVFLGLHHDRTMTTHYDSLQRGATESQVRSTMGNPPETNSACTAYGTTVNGECNHVLVYRGAFSFLTKKHWLFFVDRAGNLVDKSMQVEP